MIATIQGFVEPLVADMGMELVEIQFRREGHGWVLRLFIDKEGGIAIEDCVKVSREVGRTASRILFPLIFSGSTLSSWAPD